MAAPRMLVWHALSCSKRVQMMLGAQSSMMRTWQMLHLMMTLSLLICWTVMKEKTTMSPLMSISVIFND